MTNINLWFFCLVLSCRAVGFVSGTECASQCGDLMIVNPFGTSIDCAYSASFIIRCNKNGQTAFLGKSNLQVSRISVDGEILVLMNIHRACPNFTDSEE
ncbi:unnamed protein product [Cochlearia groenlandica]